MVSKAKLGLWERVLASQGPDGAFRSHVHLSGGPIEDSNGFATALVLDCLRSAPDCASVLRARTQAIGFLTRCQDPGQPGRFGFYPRGSKPDWMERPLPDDADDTALLCCVLLKHGALAHRRLAEVIERHLRPHRVEYLSEASEPWHEVGVFETWLDPQAMVNPVDCTVNANILTLMHLEGSPWPEAAAITRMLTRAVDWAGALRARAARLSPWYPHPIELLYAIERAARTGVPGMAELASRLRRLDWAQAGLSGEEPICGSSDGRIVWTCPALALARRMALGCQSSDSGRLAAPLAVLGNGSASPPLDARDRPGPTIL